MLKISVQSEQFLAFFSKGISYFYNKTPAVDPVFLSYFTSFYGRIRNRNRNLEQGDGSSSGSC
jgi:hypothetical protein